MFKYERMNAMARPRLANGSFGERVELAKQAKECNLSQTKNQ